MGIYRPRIGITGYCITEDDNAEGQVIGLPGQEFSATGIDYINAVCQSQMVPFPLPPTDGETLRAQLECLDGILLSGGEDLHPDSFGCKWALSDQRTSLQRDQYEIALFTKALEMGIPILGICRGLQLINACFGGTMYSDIGCLKHTSVNHYEITKPRWDPVHPVHIADNQNIQSIIGGHSLITNSIHHQAIDRLGDELQAVGYSEDHIIEAIMINNVVNVVAVQWHPEMMALKDEKALHLFHWLKEQAMTYRTHKK